MHALIDHLRALGRLVAAATLLAVAAGCGGGGSAAGIGTATPSRTLTCNPSDPATASACGTVLVSLTDAEGDFTTYTVDVLSIALERADGSRIEMLPASTRIDFASLTELAELVSSATVVPGEYVGGRIRLDYNNAEIFVEANGAIVAAQVVDTSDAPLGIADVDIRLDASETLVVTRGRTHLLAIDFDLAASHSVDTSSVPPVAVAEPYLVAEVMPVVQKELRVRGALIDVDTSAGTYRVRLRPWHGRFGDHGVVTVGTLPTTEYEIDGDSYVGTAGLDALASQPAGTLTVAFGVLDLLDRRFTASIVHAGGSIGGDALAAVHGNIVARSGDTLIVKGATVIRPDRPAHFQRLVEIQVGPETGISRVGAPGVTFDEQDLSVGQRIAAFGRLTDPAAAGANAATPETALGLDATAGRVRMLVTRLTGTVNSIDPGRVELALRGIDRLGIGMFDFTGTGGSVLTDADPLAYEIDTSTLQLDALEIGRPAHALGFVSRFGAAPPDFFARTLVGPLALRAALGIGWGPAGTSAPFHVMGSAALVPDLTNPDIGFRHHILLGDMLIDLLDLPAAPSIEPTDGRRLFSIWEPGHVELFKDFGEFVNELALRLGTNDKARALAAYGAYDLQGHRLTANQIVVHMRPAE